mgnify:CR=1 FL=1
MPGKRLGHSFLQKIFQLSIKVPELVEKRKYQYINYLTSKEKINLEKNESLETRQVLAEIDQEFEGVNSEKQLNEIIRREKLFGNSESDETSDETLNNELLNRRILYENKVIQMIANPKIIAQDESYLTNFTHLMESNPRGLKRLVSAFSIYKLLAVELGVYDFSEENKHRFVAWTIINLRWPQLVEHFEKKGVKDKNDIQMADHLDQVINSEDYGLLIKELGGPERIEDFRGVTGF